MAHHLKPEVPFTSFYELYQFQGIHSSNFLGVICAAVVVVVVVVIVAVAVAVVANLY